MTRKLRIPKIYIAVKNGKFRTVVKDGVEQQIECFDSYLPILVNGKTFVFRSYLHNLKDIKGTEIDVVVKKFTEDERYMITNEYDGYSYKVYGTISEPITVGTDEDFEKAFSDTEETKPKSNKVDELLGL